MYFLLKTKVKFTTFRIFHLQSTYDRLIKHIFVQKLFQHLCFEVGCFQIDYYFSFQILYYFYFNLVGINQNICYVLTYLFTYLLTSLLTYLLTKLLIYLLTYLLTESLTYLITYLITYLLSH